MKKLNVFSNSRMKNEAKTIKAMIAIYCNAHHGRRKDLCSSCHDLFVYAQKRLRRCPFQEKKPTCGNCHIHCYNANMKKKVTAVMKYSGPRMIYKHPVMAIRHLFESKMKLKEQQKYKSHSE